jgi:hypothetical protein
MGDFEKSVLLIVLGWAIPIVLTATWAKLPETSKQYPFAATAIISCLFAVAISLTTVVVYDRLFVADRLGIPKNSVVFAHEDAKSCPPGYRDMSTMVVGLWKGAPERFQTAKDIDLRIGLAPDWPFDHIKLCLRE